MILQGGTVGDIPPNSNSTIEALHAEASDHQHLLAGVPSPVLSAHARPSRWVRRAGRLEWRERDVVGVPLFTTSSGSNTNTRMLSQIHTVFLTP